MNPPAGKSSFALVLVNSVVILATAGLIFYTKMIYKRPAITEEGERARLASLHASPTPPPVPGMIVFDPFTVNIASNPTHPKPADDPSRQIQGKLHYATLGFVLELRDQSRKDDVEAIRPLLLDKLLSILGRKTFPELTTVQGRYLLRSQLLEIANQLVNPSGEKTSEPGPNFPPSSHDLLVTNVYFTQFIVQ